MDSTSLKRRRRPSTVAPTSGSCDEHHVAERVLGVVGDADPHPAALDAATHSWSRRVAEVVGDRSWAGALQERSNPRRRGSRAARALSAAAGGCGGRTPGPAPGLGVGGGLGPDVGDRLLGVGQGQRPAVVVEHLHAVDEHAARGPCCSSTSVRMTSALLLPRRDHRLVGQVRARAGRRRPRTARRRVRASSSSSFTSAAAASKAGRKPGRMKPPSRAGGEADARLARPRPSAPASTASCSRTRTPCSADDRLGVRGDGDRQGDACRRAGGSHTSATKRQQRLGRRSSTWPSSSISVRCSPSGSMHRAEVGARGPDQAGRPARRARRRSKSMAPGGRGVRVHGQDVGARAWPARWA